MNTEVRSILADGPHRTSTRQDFDSLIGPSGGQEVLRDMHSAVRQCLPEESNDGFVMDPDLLSVTTRIYGNASLAAAVGNLVPFVEGVVQAGYRNISIVSTPDYAHLDGIVSAVKKKYGSRVNLKMLTRGNPKFRPAFRHNRVDDDTYNTYTLPNVAILDALGYDTWGRQDFDAAKVHPHWVNVSQDLYPFMRYLDFMNFLACSHCDVKSVGIAIPRVHNIRSLFEMIDTNSAVGGLLVSNYPNYGHNNAFTLRSTVPFTTFSESGGLNWRNIMFPRFADGFGFVPYFDPSGELVNVGGNEDQALLLKQLSDRNPLLGVNFFLIPRKEDMDASFGTEVSGYKAKTLRRSTVMSAYIRRVATLGGIPEHVLYGRLDEHIKNGTFWVIADESTDSSVCVVQPGIDVKRRINIPRDEMNVFIANHQENRIREYDGRLL